MYLQRQKFGIATYSMEPMNLKNASTWTFDVLPFGS